MKIWKKNLVAAGILVTVCCGIYLNWTAGGGKDTMDLEEALNSDKLMNDSLLVMGDQVEQLPQEENTVTDYFAAVRLSRQKARDSAVSLLQEAMSYGDAEATQQTNAQLEQIIQTALVESTIESLVIAKGYADCVAYISENGISVAVASPEGGMQQNDVAIIADIVMSQTDLELTQIRVVEV